MSPQRREAGTFPVEGHCASGFEPLARVFAQSVESGGERGGIAVIVDGETKVELWGGPADPAAGRPWRRDTLACCFSVSKGVVSLLAHRLIDLGILDPARPVADLWPEFAENGKAAITVHDVLTHRAGLPAVSGTVEPGSLYDWQAMTRLLAASRCVVQPRASPVYHNMTYGHLLGEVLVRASGADSLSVLLQRELCGPFAADFRFALTDADAADLAFLTREHGGDLMATLDRPAGTLFERSMLFFARDEDFNTARWRGAEIGSGSGHATALGIARLYGQLASESSLLSAGRRHAARTEFCRSDGPDPVMGIPIRYSEGFELSNPPWLDFGPRAGIVGYWGAGGATGIADAATRMSFGYVTGNMSEGFGSSSRARALVSAVFACL